MNDFESISMRIELPSGAVISSTSAVACGDTAVPVHFTGWSVVSSNAKTTRATSV